MKTPNGRVVRAAAAAVFGAAAAHVGPAATWLRPVRMRLAPTLAGVGRAGHVALTFDDGPDPRSTPYFLEVLAAHGVSATFFLLGERVVQAPALAAEIAGAGHELAVHGFGHRTPLACGPRATYADLARARDTVAEAAGRQPTFWRPPYGILTGAGVAAAARLGLTPVLWTAWGRDWLASSTPGSVLATVLEDLEGGGTVLLHDSDYTCAPQSWQSALGALPDLLDVCDSHNWTVGPLAAHHADTVADTGAARPADQPAGRPEVPTRGS